MPSPSTTASIKVVKSMLYRGQTRLWSNRYHFKTGAPADSAHWTTLSDAIVTAEKICYSSAVTIVQTVGYLAGSEVPVFTKNYTTAGTLSPAGAALCPGDCCALIRYSTTARTPKNHPVYLFNYHHGVFRDATSQDTVLASQVTSLNAFAAQWIGAGFSDGATAYNRAGPHGATAVGQLVETAITHRDFPR